MAQMTLSVIIFLISTIFTNFAHGYERRTKYGCEGTTLKIECEEGTVINLVRANFGRFSISICNDEGITDWSVNCMEPRTLRIINARCEKKPRCRIPVDSTIFGDPCPGTNKYVEVHYTCEPAASSSAPPTSKALPPWLLDLAATPSSVPEIIPEVPSSTAILESTSTLASTSTESTTSTTTTTTDATSLNTVLNPIFSRSTSKSTDLEENSLPADVRHFGSPDHSGSMVKTEEYTDESDYAVERSDENVKVLVENVVDHCRPKTVRNLFWNWTRQGEDAIQVCPQGSTGFARWTCGPDGVWSSPTPNLGECQSQWLSRLESKLTLGGGSSVVVEIAGELSASTEMKSLYGGDLIIAAKILQSIAHRLRQELYVISSQNEKETLASEVLQSVLKTISNLLDPVQRLAWEDLETRKRAAAVTAMLVSAEENALLLAETVNNEKNVAEATNHVISSVRVMRARGVNDQVFPILENIHNDEDTQVVVPSRALIENSVNGAVRIVFFLFENLDAALPNKGLKLVNSKIVSVVASKTRFADISETPVEVTLKHLETDNGNKSPICAVWDYNNKIWSDKECSLLTSNSTHSTCQCSRLGHYAVLVEDILSAAPQGSNKKPQQDLEEIDQKSHLTTAIICAVALFLCLFLAIVGLVVFKRWDVRLRIDKFMQSRKLPCFHCKKSESSSSAGGLYPALTSSPTSTTVSADTPTTGVSSSNYLVQILEQQAETMKQVKASGKIVQQHCKGSIYRVSAPRSQYNMNQGTMNGVGNVFRPVSPYGHHIYMEIDPVYAHTAAESNSEVHSDIQLSDISDDDLKRFSDNSRASSNRYGEERPLIRANQLRQSVPMGDPSRHCFTTHRPGHLQQNAILSQNSQFIRPLHLATLSASCSHQSLRGYQHPQMTQQRRQPLHQLYHQASTAQALDTPITIALQGGEQFVSLQIGEPVEGQCMQQEYPEMTSPSLVYAPFHIHQHH